MPLSQDTLGAPKSGAILVVVLAGKGFVLLLGLGHSLLSHLKSLDVGVEPTDLSLTFGMFSRKLCTDEMAPAGGIFKGHRDGLIEHFPECYCLISHGSGGNPSGNCCVFLGLVHSILPLIGLYCIVYLTPLPILIVDAPETV